MRPYYSRLCLIKQNKGVTCFHHITEYNERVLAMFGIQVHLAISFTLKHRIKGVLTYILIPMTT